MDDHLRRAERVAREAQDASDYFTALRRTGLTRLDAARRIAESVGVGPAIRAVVAQESTRGFLYAGVGQPTPKATSVKVSKSPIPSLTGVLARVQSRAVKSKKVIDTFDPRHGAAIGIAAAILSLAAFERAHPSKAAREAIIGAIGGLEGRATVAELDTLNSAAYALLSLRWTHRPEYYLGNSPAQAAIHAAVYTTVISSDLMETSLAAWTHARAGAGYAMQALWNLEVDRIDAEPRLPDGRRLDPRVDLTAFDIDDSPYCFAFLHVAAIDLLDAPVESLGEVLRRLLESVATPA